MKNRVHIDQVIPDARWHIFHGYDEIIETVAWGLRQLGRKVTTGINSVQPDATNIVFGAQMLEGPALEKLPRDSVIYNLEQMAGLEAASIREGMRYCARHFTIWDYSELNFPVWRAVAPEVRLQHVPVGYAPVLTRIAKPKVQDIDVLFYGGPGGERLRVFEALCNALLRTVFVHGLYGAGRDGLIARAKLVLNVNQYADTGVFEIARVSYLLANSKAVVSDLPPRESIEPDLAEALCFVPREMIVNACLDLLRDDAARARLEACGFAAFSKRDIKPALAAALSAG